MDVKLKLRFHPGTQRWFIYEGNRMLNEIQTGDGLMIHLDQQLIGATVGMDVEWYLTIGTSQFWLHPKSTYTVEFPF
jgi:hypothetical protein